MVELGYNTGVNRIKSDGLLSQHRHPFSTYVRGVDTMSYSISNSPTTQNIIEEWRSAVGWEGLYEVSSQGRVRSLPRYVESKLPNQNGGYWRKGCILKPSPDSAGHLSVVLYDGNGPRSARIHVLIAATFIGERPEGYDTHHKSEDKTDNRPSNLEYIEHGSHTVLHCAGEKSTSSKLAADDVIEIRRLATVEKLSQSQIAAMFGISQSCVWMIKHRKSWRHLNNES